MVGGHIRIHDSPPLIFHPEEAQAKDFQILHGRSHSRLPDIACR